jgi:hypothetical protein
VLSGGTAFSAAALGAAAIGGAVGSLASQAFAVGVGLQDSINWKGVALSAVGSMVTAGVGSYGVISVPGSPALQAGVNAAVGNVATQGLAIAFHQQDKFNWRGVAAAGVGAAVSSQIGDLFKSAGYGEGMLQQVVKGGATSITTQLITTGKVDWRSVGAGALEAVATQKIKDMKLDGVEKAFADGLVGAGAAAIRKQNVLAGAFVGVANGYVAQHELTGATKYLAQGLIGAGTAKMNRQDVVAGFIGGSVGTMVGDYLPTAMEKVGVDPMDLSQPAKSGVEVSRDWFLNVIAGDIGSGVAKAVANWAGRDMNVAGMIGSGAASQAYNATVQEGRAARTKEVNERKQAAAQQRHQALVDSLDASVRSDLSKPLQSGAGDLPFLDSLNSDTGGITDNDVVDLGDGRVRLPDGRIVRPSVTVGPGESYDKVDHRGDMKFGDPAITMQWGSGTTGGVVKPLATQAIDGGTRFYYTNGYLDDLSGVGAKFVPQALATNLELLPGALDAMQSRFGYLAEQGGDTTEQAQLGDYLARWTDAVKAGDRPTLQAAVNSDLAAYISGNYSVGDRLQTLGFMLNPDSPWAKLPSMGDSLIQFGAVTATGVAGMMTGGWAFTALRGAGIGLLGSGSGAGVVGDLTTQGLDNVINFGTNGRFGRSGVDGYELAFSGLLGGAPYLPGAIRSTAQNLRAMGVPDWNINYAPSPGTLYSGVPVPFELERIGSTFQARTATVKDIPTFKSGGFNDWFDARTPDEIATMYEQPALRAKIESGLRGAGGNHEMLMVAEAPQWSQWGVRAKMVQEDFAISIADLNEGGLANGWRHSTGLEGSTAPMSKTVHNELQNIIKNSNGLNEFKINIAPWAEKWINGGYKALPPGFHK